MLIKSHYEVISIRLISLLLMMYSAMIPLENVLATSIGGSVNMYIGLFTMFFICIWCIRNNITKAHFPKWIAFFSIYAFGTMYWSIDQNFQILSVMLNVVIFTFIAIQYPLSLNEKNKIIFSIFLGGVIVSGLMLSGGDFTSINTIDRDRMTIIVGGLIVDNNNLALSLSICSLCGFSLVYKVKSSFFFKTIMLIGIALCFIAILRTGSRGALLALTVGGAIFLFFSNSGLSLKAIVIGTFFVLFGLYYIQNFMSDSLASRFTIDEVIASGGTGRIDIWVNAVSYYQGSNIGRWLFGYGFGSFPSLMREAMGKPWASHNDVVQMLLETGLIGLFLYFKMWAEIFFNVLKKKNATALALITIVAIGSLSMEMLIKKMLWLVFYIAIITSYDDVKIKKV